MKVHIILALAMSFVFGCTHKDIESEVYREHGGRIRCSRCDLIHNQRHKTHVKEELSKGYEGDPLCNILSCEKCRREDGKSFTSCYYDIESVSAESSGINDVWNVTISLNCNVHGNVSIHEQYAYENHGVRFIKSL